MSDAGPLDDAMPALLSDDDGPVFRFPVRVYYEDTDAGGIVYHAAYLRFAERARTEVLRLTGVTHVALWRDSGVAFAVRRCEIDYLIPARLDDLLAVHTRIANISGATLEMHQSIHRTGSGGAEAVLTRLSTKLACIDKAGRAVRLPSAVRIALANAFRRAGN
ncbi:MAG: tol-pal system-associated acyl-CoA thioesterase [Azospirillaceae bacterium]|nr:tol-pal system-associated acyl-CoA thioesterase [Azospirillaceae bacterium]